MVLVVEVKEGSGKGGLKRKVRATPPIPYRKVRGACVQFD